MDEQVTRRVLYGGESANVCAYCFKHYRALTPKQLKRKECLAKQCGALKKLDHPFWEEREERKQKRKDRKDRFEKLYEQSTERGQAHAVHSKATPADSAGVSQNT